MDTVIANVPPPGENATFVPKLVGRGFFGPEDDPQHRRKFDALTDPGRAFGVLREAAETLAAEARAQQKPGLVTGLVSRSGRLISWHRSTAGRFGATTVVAGRNQGCDLRANVRHFPDRAALLAQRLVALDQALVLPIEVGTMLPVRVALPAVVPMGPVAWVMISTPFRSQGLDWLDEALACRPETLPPPTRPASVRFELPADTPTANAMTDTLTPARMQALMAELLGKKTARTARVTQIVNEQIFLIGGSEHCHGPTRHWEIPVSLSRVHAMMFNLGNERYLADTASAHGVQHDSLGGTRLRHLVPGDSFSLGALRMIVEDLG